MLLSYAGSSRQIGTRLLLIAIRRQIRSPTAPRPVGAIGLWPMPIYLCLMPSVRKAIRRAMRDTSEAMANSPSEDPNSLKPGEPTT